MTNIERDVARSTIRMNKAVASHLEEIDWEQRRYEIAKEDTNVSAKCNNGYIEWWQTALSVWKDDSQGRYWLCGRIN